VTRTVFLDRDGTLNREVGFVSHPEQIEVLPGVPAALRRLISAGFRIVVVTNQSGIARGLYSEEVLAAIHRKLHRELGELPAAYLHCPHHPDVPGPYGGACPCRKPAPGLFLQARELLGAELEGAFVAGDSARDLLAARGLPLRTIYLRSGIPPANELQALAAARAQPDHVADHLPAAVEWILRQSASQPPPSTRPPS
jgi:D-glycero-D-manno-heptose 1,7-bisphosphate phosphatase